ncbi:hypothetical protein H0H87_005167 [Tephrocybe sp. NHM501043]|nr:hypothetical protein H0H87_005167 [Tephrocybe sp. NHM501043]
MAGLGIRFSQDVGAHRKDFRDKLTIESESWKRCFWILVCIDAMLCSFLGRPRATTSYDDVIREIASYAQASASAQVVNQDGQSNNPNLLVTPNFQLRTSQGSLYHGQPQAAPSSSWKPDLISQPQGWQPQPSTEVVDVGPDHSGWWHDVQAANEPQYNFGTGLSSYGNAPRAYIPNAQGIPQWSLMTPSGEASMDAGDVAMLWLQTPQLSEWMDVGRY